MIRGSSFLAWSAICSLAGLGFATQTLAQDARTEALPRVELQTPTGSDYDTLRERLAPNGIGLMPPSSANWKEIDLPFSLRYSIATRSLLVPLDDKKEWGVGLMLNVNPGLGLETSTAPTFGLEPRRTPGITLQKKF